MITKKIKPTCDVPAMNFENIALDSGHLIISEQEKLEFENKYPQFKHWIKELMGAIELLYSKKRYCFWLVDVYPSDLRKVPELLERIKKVKNARLLAKDKGTQKLASRPSQFRDLKNPEKYVGVPIASENRDYIPMIFLDKNCVPAVTIQAIPDAEIYHFGVLVFFQTILDFGSF